MRKAFFSRRISNTFIDFIRFYFQQLRLSELVVPTLYELHLHPDLTPAEEGGRFTGNVKILLDVQEATREIVLHSHELIVTSAKFTAPDPNVRVLVNSLKHSSKSSITFIAQSPELSTDYRTRATQGHAEQ